MLLLLLCLPFALFGTTKSSAQSLGDKPSATATVATPYTDTLRALIVFTKFKDDVEPGDPNVYFRGWPLFDDPQSLPTFADALLAPTPDPPFVDSTLTAYFHQQSLGQFVLYGDVYDSVLVSLQPEAAYHRPNGGYGYLTAEILDRIDVAGFDFSRYDHNRDGLLDYLFLVLRRDAERDAKKFTFTGISCLDARCGGGITAGRPSGRDTLRYDGITVDWRSSGSIMINRTAGNIIPQRYYIRQMAHELGHDLWQPFYTHIPAITANDVPRTSNRSRRATNVLGYVLLAGAGGGLDARGDETISAFERDLLGWIDCTVLTEEQAAIHIADLYTTSACIKLPLGGSDAGRVLYLTNRQRLGPFDVLREGGIDTRYEMGQLRTTGLLAMLVDGIRVDVLPADNTLDLSVRNAAYEGDLWGPSTATQLTPWTRPNIHGYTHYPAAYEPSWQAIDNIRYIQNGDSTMAFDYHADFRQHTVFREESWIGDETAGYHFENEVVVERGTTLHLGTALTFADGLRVEAGATVLVDVNAQVTLGSDSVLDLARGATVVVRGRLQMDGLLQHRAGARLLTEDNGTISVSLDR